MRNQLPCSQDDLMGCDYKDIFNEQAVPYLVPEIQQLYYHSELIEQNKRRINIDGKDRSIILDFISHYHTKFNFANESFENAIYIFDNIVKNNIVRRCDLCMIAMACLLLAAKNEQTYIVSIQYFVEALEKINILYYGPYVCKYVCCDQCLYCGIQGVTQPKTIRLDDTQASLSKDSDYAKLTQYYYTQLQEPTTCRTCLRKALCNTEILCLQLLNYKINYVIPLNFLRRYITILNLRDKDKYITFYLAGILLLDDHASQMLSPSEIALAAIVMEQRLTRKETWPTEMQQYSCFTINKNITDIHEYIKNISHLTNDVLKRMAQKESIQVKDISVQVPVLNNQYSK